MSLMLASNITIAMIVLDILLSKPDGASPISAPTDTTTSSPASILDEHRSSPGLLLALLGQEAMRRLRAAHTAHNLKPRQFQILGLLHDHGGLAQRELMQEMDVDPSILVTLLNPLEGDGLVTRERDPSDRRRHLVTLTPAGERHLASASRAQKETEDALFASLADDQRGQLRALLVTLRDGLAAHPESACSAREAGR
jgi:DNA-binding MarR family transcriptional regulator